MEVKTVCKEQTEICKTQQGTSRISTGLEYGSSIAINTAKKETKNLLDDGYHAITRGMSKEQRRCRFHHHDYCQKLDNTSAMSKECFANGLFWVERDNVLSRILDEVTSKQLHTNEKRGKSNFDVHSIKTFLFILTSVFISLILYRYFNRIVNLSGTKRT